MRLLVVRCLAFVVVQALMRARGNAGVNAGTLSSLCSACRAESIFKATAGLSVCVSTVRFGLPWRGFGLFGNWEGRMSVVLSGELCSTGAASYSLTRLFGFGLRFCRRAVCVAGVRSRGT